MNSTRLLGCGAVSALAMMLALAATPAAAATPATIPAAIPAAVTSGAPGTSGVPAVLPETLAPASQLQDQRGRGGRGEGRANRGGGLGGGARAGDTGAWNGAQGRANRGGGRWNGGAQSVRNTGDYDRAMRNANRAAPSANVPARPARYNQPDRAGAASPNGYGGGYAGRAGRAANAAPPAYQAGTGAERIREGRGRRFDRAQRGLDNPAGGAGVNNPAAINQAEARGARAGRQGRDWNSGRSVTARGGERGDARGNWRRDNVGRDDAGRGNWRGDRRDGWRDGRRVDNRRDGWRDNRRDGWRDNRRDGWRGDRRDGWRGGRQAAFNQGFRSGVRWDRGWRNNNRFNWIGHRRANRFLFAPGPYFAPFSGHFYRPVGIGFRLDPLFFQPRFFLNDPWAFRLPPAGDRFRWVRYYEDVLLVDVFTGEVVDVIENFFW